MKGFRRVLAAIDFSPSSARVLDAARGLLEPGGALRLLHVVPWVPSVVEGAVMGYGSPAALRAVHEESERKLAETARSLEGVDVTTEVDEGEPSVVILDAADEWDADLVVVGSGRHPTFAGLRPGGVVERLLRRARRPFLVVPA